MVFLRADGSHPPEMLARLLYPALVGGSPLVCAPGVERRLDVFGAGLPFGRALLRLVGHGLPERGAGTPAARLPRQPARLRHVGGPLHSLPARGERSPLRGARGDAVPRPGRGDSRGAGTEHSDAGHPPARSRHPIVGACWAALDYRLHQLRVTQQGRYLVDRGVQYTFKQSSTGSHMQIVGCIRRGSRVLDLGCSQGMLARPLAERARCG